MKNELEVVVVNNLTEEEKHKILDTITDYLENQIKGGEN